MQRRRGALRPKKTTDAASTDIAFRFPFDIPGAYHVRFTVNALSRDGLAFRVWELVAGVRIERAGSPYVADEGLAVLNVGSDSDEWDIDLVVNDSGSLVMRVTGDDGATITWTASYEVTP